MEKMEQLPMTEHKKKTEDYKAYMKIYMKEYNQTPAQMIKKKKEKLAKHQYRIEELNVKVAELHAEIQKLETLDKN